MSTKPGLTTCPDASMVVAARPGTSPTATIRPSRTPTSPSNPGRPVPSTTKPSRITRSYSGCAISLLSLQLSVDPSQLGSVPLDVGDLDLLVATNHVRQCGQLAGQ